MLASKCYGQATNVIKKTDNNNHHNVLKFILIRIFYIRVCCRCIMGIGNIHNTYLYLCIVYTDRNIIN